MLKGDPLVAHLSQRGIPSLEAVGDSMTGDGPKEDASASEEEEWQLYSSAGYASADDPWDDLVAINEDADEEEWFDGDDFETGGQTVDWDSPPCPAPLGIVHMIRIGTCNHCLHRVAGRRTEETGAEAGATLRKEAFARDKELESSEIPELCPLCENLFEDVENIVERIVEQTGELDHGTIQIGVHVPKDLIQEEDRIRTRHGAPGARPLKASFTESIQMGIRQRMDGVEFVKERPDLMILIDCLTLRVDVDIRPVFIYGRYRKLERGIPQTRWPCRACRGRDGGCESCEGSGLQYLDSVQDLIGEAFRLALRADNTSFHGMGREDIDVRCLGRGRPFVLEVKHPKVRRTDLEEIEKAVNSNAAGKVEISELRWTNRSEVSRIKETRAEKSYTIRFTIEDPPEDSSIIESISSLSGVTLEQQTPKRVSHRRADKNRKRKITSVDNIVIDGTEIQFSVRCEAGTYVKELVHSDEGRTVPSVAGVLERECQVTWLDVEDIHAD